MLLGIHQAPFCQRDHIWVYNRSRSLTNEEAGLEGPLPGAKDENGQPVNALSQVRAYGPIADCCKAAPSVLEFDAGGSLLRAWGGPSDPGFIGGKCKAEAGCIWPNSEHGIYVDHKDNVWISGNAAAGRGGSSGGSRAKSPWTTNEGGGDGFVLKFDMDGNFKMRIGGTPRGPDSNNTNGGINGTPLLYQAADMAVDPKTNRLYVSDGRRRKLCRPRRASRSEPEYGRTRVSCGPPNSPRSMARRCRQ